MSKKNIGVIYAVRNKKSGKTYVAQTTQDPRLRLLAHFNTKTSTAFYADLQKFGRDSFELEVLRECKTREDLNKWEQFHILEQMRKSPALCYNVRIIPRHIPGNPVKGINSKSRIHSVRILAHNEKHLEKRAKANPANPHFYIATEINALIDADREYTERTGKFRFHK